MTRRLAAMRLNGRGVHCGLGSRGDFLVVGVADA